MRNNQTIKTEILLAALFFLLYMGQSVWMAFLNLYLESKAFTGAQIGLVGAAYQGAIFLAAPIMGALADKYGIKKILTLLAGSAVLMLFFYSQIDLFVIILLYTFFLASMTQSIGPLIDTLALNFVKNNLKSSYGRFRLWGSLSWAISTYLMGFVLARYHISIIFPLAAFVFIILFLIVLLYPVNEIGRNISGLKISHIKMFTGNKTIIYFCLLLLLYGMAIAPVNIFINIYFYDIGASYDIVGKAFAIQAISEIPFFFFSIYFVRKYGAKNMITISIVVTLLRFVLYSVTSNPVVALWINLANGFTFSLFFVAVVEFFHDLVPENLRATGQALIWAFHFGAGVTLGNILIGNLYDFMGMQDVMKIHSGLILLSLILFVVFFRRIRTSTG